MGVIRLVLGTQVVKSCGQAGCGGCIGCDSAGIGLVVNTYDDRA